MTPPAFTLRVAEQTHAAVGPRPVMSSSTEAADHVRPLIGNLDRETFIILHLDTKNRLIDAELHGIGDVDSSAVYPRQVMRSALLRNSSALIFAHNHPSGDPEPSLADRELTGDLVRAASALQIKVLDHVIVGPEPRYFSFSDSGLIDEYALGARS